MMKNAKKGTFLRSTKGSKPIIDLLAVNCSNVFRFYVVWKETLVLVYPCTEIKTVFRSETCIL